MNYRTGNLEFRRLREERPAEIIRWAKNGDGTEYCYTLLWYKRDNEGFYVEFVGRRPFDDDLEGLWELMEYGQDTLDAEFKLEEKLKWK
jgi:hypothetical protein